MKRLFPFKCEIRLDLEPFWAADVKLARKHRECSYYVCFKVMTAASCRVVSNSNSQSFTRKCISLCCGGFTLNWIDVCLGLICTLVRAVTSNHCLEDDKRCLLPPRGLQGYFALLVYSSISKTSRMFSTSRPAVGTPSPFYFFLTVYVRLMQGDAPNRLWLLDRGSGTQIWGPPQAGFYVSLSSWRHMQCVCVYNREMTCNLNVPKPQL